MRKSAIIYRFNVETPTPEDSTLSMLWFGGPLKLSKKPGYVFLTNPNGEKMMEVAKVRVHPITEEESAKVILDEAELQQARQAKNN